MAEKRNNDWTDALRERLSSSELVPGREIWSKVEEAAALSGGRKERKVLPVWWTAVGIAACAAAAMVLFYGKGAEQLDTITPSGIPEVIAELVSDAVEDTTGMSVEGLAPPAAKKAAAASLTAAVNKEDTYKVVQEASEESFRPSEVSAPAEMTDIADNEDSGYSGPASVQSTDCYFTDYPSEKQRKHISASIFAAGLPSSYQDVGNQTDFVTPVYSTMLLANGMVKQSPAQAEVYPVSPVYQSIMHSRPLNLGLSLTYPLTQQAFVESGLVYSLLRSEYEMSKDQKLHFLGIPARLGWQFNPSGKVNFSISAGAMAEKCIYAEQWGERQTEAGIQFSAVAGASVRYRLSGNAGLFLAPEWSYYFTETSLETFRTEHPSSLNLRLGLSIDLR